ncbi:hypothetical protein [Aeromicrobium stalagmiti]|uniref:hypothetical protein n=1 Tax=Aeromicrobium stalagmiti TaxID=2738988 RepID=UPI00156858B8|nr:hypothetical protein [Aeromicrobium stalagmiti]NRQ51128.1 hypothetical protein [Aeromicrobium stalagmiti]
MRWIRKHPRQSAGLFAVAIGIVLAVLAATNLLGGDDSDPLAGSGDSSTEGPVEDPFLGPAEDIAPDDTPPTSLADLDPNQGRVDFAGSNGGGGLQGQGATTGLPRHSLTVRMTSKEPIRGVGYIIPTSLAKYYGVERNVGTSWTLKTTVYGDPAYAQVFSQAGARGFPVTCTISVDGKVTEQRATEGPYGQLYCVG